MLPKANIAPSLLASNLARLSEECKALIDSGAHSLHMDVMDGNFVPNISFGVPVIHNLRKETEAFIDCHMMVAKPDQWVEPMKKAGANMYTFHIESEFDRDAKQTIDSIRAAGMKVGIALKPKTPVGAVLPFVREVDMVLVMTVEPGFGGQKFMGDMMPKVEELRTKFPSLDIQVDGGIDVTNVQTVADAGANVIVSGTGVIKHSGGYADAIAQMTKAVDAALKQRGATAQE